MISSITDRMSMEAAAVGTASHELIVNVLVCKSRKCKYKKWELTKIIVWYFKKCFGFVKKVTFNFRTRIFTNFFLFRMTMR